MAATERVEREPDHEGPPHADHFESLEKQSHAAHLGMWVFLASEVLLFGGLFALYASYRVGNGLAFTEGIDHDDKLLGSINTVVLLTSSYTVARAVLSLRRGR